MDFNCQCDSNSVRGEKCRTWHLVHQTIHLKTKNSPRNMTQILNERIQWHTQSVEWLCTVCQIWHQMAVNTNAMHNANLIKNGGLTKWWTVLPTCFAVSNKIWGWLPVTLCVSFVCALAIRWGGRSMQFRAQIGIASIPKVQHSHHSPIEFLRHFFPRAIAWGFRSRLAYYSSREMSSLGARQRLAQWTGVPSLHWQARTGVPPLHWQASNSDNIFLKEFQFLN